MESLSGSDFSRAELPPGIHIPDTADLYDALENILWFWPSVFVQLVKEDQWDRVFDLTRAVRLTGQCEGVIFLRTSRKLGELLASSLLEDLPVSPEDAFGEFANMFCGHIMNKIRRSDAVDFRHFLPTDLPYSGKPDRPADARMAVAVGGLLLDVELWIESVPEALGKA